MISENFVFLGAFIQLLGVGSYLRSTLEGKTRPNRVSFFLWSVAPLVAFAAQISQGVSITSSLVTFLSGFSPLAIFIASFVNRKSEWKLNQFDLACGTLSVVGLILWYVTKVGNVAIVFSIIADGLACLPTIVKSFYYPETENGAPYLTSVVNVVITLLTIKMASFANVGFPIYLFVANLMIYVLVQFKLGKLVVDTRSRT